MGTTIKRDRQARLDAAVLARCNTTTLWQLLDTELLQLQGDVWGDLSRQQRARKLQWARDVARELKGRGTQGRLF